MIATLLVELRRHQLSLIFTALRSPLSLIIVSGPSSQTFIPIKERSYAGLSSGGNPSKLFRSLLNPLDSDQLWKMEKL